MKLKNSSKESFELRIIQYEFPNINNEKYDANWLLIEIEVSDQYGQWVVKDPCLLTFDIQNLGNWLLSIAAGEEVISKFQFMEPELEFHLIRPIEEEYILRIYMRHNLKPQWKSSRGREAEDFWLDFPVDSLVLQRLANSLHQQLMEYPPRVTDQ